MSNFEKNTIQQQRNVSLKKSFYSIIRIAVFIDYPFIRLDYFFNTTFNETRNFYLTRTKSVFFLLLLIYLFRFGHTLEKFSTEQFSHPYLHVHYALDNSQNRIMIKNHKTYYNIWL